MKLFSCSHCRQVVFFESVACVACGHRLAYLPDQRVIAAIVPEQQDGEPATSWYRALSADDAPPRGAGAPPDEVTRYRLCENGVRHGACNWAVPEADDRSLCLACGLNRTIPDLSAPETLERWRLLEAAKRRLIHSLIERGLPIDGQGGEHTLAFVFAADRGERRVFTGHDRGVITINVDEADAPFRERVRVQLGEPYRTLLGHFRHEIAHYYWERSIANGARLEAFRELFGDERADYRAALERHYREGPPADWQGRFITAYASMHPWEDWAETFAHYLHITDTLDTARSYDLALQPSPLGGRPLENVVVREVDFGSLDEVLRAWVPLTLALNSLNRGMGLADVYPFVLHEAAITKLRFVHDLLQDVAREAVGDATKTTR